MYTFLPIKFYFSICAVTIILSFLTYNEAVNVYVDVPCIPLYYQDSAVCVCNTTYCDALFKQIPKIDTYFAYTSSKAGKRFSKDEGTMGGSNLLLDSISNNVMVLELRPDILYQTIEGFGGAVTDAAGINWKSLNSSLQQYLIDSYFSESGLEYNMIRVPNGSTDFSTRPYTYNEYPVNDTLLTNFTLAPEDIEYKVPMIQASMKASKTEIKVITSTWAPPDWMLLKDDLIGTKYLNEEYYQTYADYQCKFAELYNEQGIKIWGLSPVNEPLTPIVGVLKDESTFWSTSKMVKLLENNLGPTIRNCSVKDIRILAIDDQRYNLPLWFSDVRWVDWNMCLNREGGPTWIKNYVDSPIIVDAENQRFYKQPTFYAMGHFSKFVPRGSRRIKVIKRFPLLDPLLDLQDIEALGQDIFDHVAFLTPQNTIVVIIHNEGPSKSAAIHLGQKRITVNLDAESITTIELPYNEVIDRVFEWETYLKEHMN